MSRFWSILLAAWIWLGCISPLLAQSEGLAAEAAVLAAEARKAIVEGQFQTAAEKFARAAKLCPNDNGYVIGLAHARYFLKDFDGAMALTLPLLEAKKTSPEAFQVYGNCQDARGQRYEALQTYRRGLERFPKSGALYMEMGVLEFGRHRDAEALAYWEQGIRVQPTFSANYYFAARQLLVLGDYGWAAVYAEQCINIASGGEQVRAMSELLMQAHERARFFDFEKAYKWRFFQVRDSLTGEPMPSPRMEQLMDEAFSSEFMDTTAQLTISRLADVRRFVCQWLPRQQRRCPTAGLLKWQQAVARAGHNEAYHYWLLQDARPDETAQWLSTHEAEFEAFEQWFGQNAYVGNLKRAVVRPNIRKEERQQ